MSKQFVNDVANIAILATCWHEVPMPPLEGEVPNEREAEGFVRKLSKKTPQSARSGCQLPFQGSQGGFAARVANLATRQHPVSTAPGRGGSKPPAAAQPLNIQRTAQLCQLREAKSLPYMAWAYALLYHHLQNVYSCNRRDPSLKILAIP